MDISNFFSYLLIYSSIILERINKITFKGLMIHDAISDHENIIIVLKVFCALAIIHAACNPIFRKIFEQNFIILFKMDTSFSLRNDTMNKLSCETSKAIVGHHEIKSEKSSKVQKYPVSNQKLKSEAASRAEEVLSLSRTCRNLKEEKDMGTTKNSLKKNIDKNFRKTKILSHSQGQKSKKKPLKNRKQKKGENYSGLDTFDDTFTLINKNYIHPMFSDLCYAPDRSNGNVCRCVERCTSFCPNRMALLECNLLNCNLKHLDCGNRQFLSKKENNLILSRTTNKGIGLFTKQNFEPHELVIEYVGEIISNEMHRIRCNKRALDELENKKKQHWYILKASKNVYIDSTKKGNLARFANHSCDPNCEILCFVVNGRYRVGIFSQHSIKADEEITYDYRFDSTGIGNGFYCKCESSNCRGMIGNNEARESFLKNKLNILMGLKETNMRSSFEELSRALVNSNCLNYSTYSGLPTFENPARLMKRINHNYYYIPHEFGPFEVKYFDVLDDNISPKIIKEKSESDSETSNNMDDTHNSDFKNNNLLMDLLFDVNFHMTYVARNYIKSLALNGKTAEEWDIALTKKFAIDIPWAIFVDHYSESQLEFIHDFSAAFNEAYVRGRRYLTRLVILLTNKFFGKSCSEKFQELIDSTWGSTEVCTTCGHTGLMRNCCYCGEIYHAQSICCDWTNLLDRDFICGICCNDDHRARWIHFPETVKEELADLANKERFRILKTKWEKDFVLDLKTKNLDLRNVALYSPSDLPKLSRESISITDYTATLINSIKNNGMGTMDIVNNSDKIGQNNEILYDNLNKYYKYETDSDSDSNSWEKPWCSQ